MAILRYFKGATIQENNIVQTVASAAGTLSSIIFVLPGLIMIGWWTGASNWLDAFPYWQSFAICALGGILGVMYSIPLRRALVTNSDLPYPEGLACAEVLKVGAGELGGSASAAAENRAGLLAVVWGSIASAAFALIVATRVFAGDVVKYFRVGGNGTDAGGGVTGFDFFLSFALFGIGHLVGLWVGVAMLVGALIGWGWGVPHFSAMAPAAGAIADLAGATWSHKVRFVGAGTIGVAAIWTLLKLVKPVASGLSSAMAASRVRAAGNAGSLPRTEQDIPIGTVGLVSLACMVPIGWLLWNFATTAGAPYGLGDHLWLLVGGGVAFIVLMSFFVSAVCGYMAGLIGSSNSPLSGIGIIVVIGAALLLVFGVRGSLPESSHTALVAFALFVTSIVFTVAAIANNNLQDLKTGQLVDATPAKQQWALVIGVLAGAAIIPPILDLLNRAYGFTGAPGATAHALAAPQAGLISALAKGVITNDIDWSLIQIGAGIGVAAIFLDVILRRTTKSAHLAPLAVGLGIYLPTQSTLMVVVGAVVGWWFDRKADRESKNPESTKQLGVLLASGMIVGEGLIGVLVAALVGFSEQLGFSNHDFPLSVVSDD
ncbi:MAG TPA: oligopeptide transporter, OPT family, partial [Xanthomonadaceae bacterium]|nr:oligopeptide transporter, OPT family [Xanthomonadaceae bacterium]